MSEKKAKEQRRNPMGPTQNADGKPKQTVAQIVLTAYDDGDVKVEAPLGNLPLVVDMLGTAVKTIGEAMFEMQQAAIQAKKEAESPLIVDPNSKEGQQFLAPGSKLRQ